MTACIFVFTLRRLVPVSRVFASHVLATAYKAIPSPTHAYRVLDNGWACLPFVYACVLTFTLRRLVPVSRGLYTRVPVYRVFMSVFLTPLGLRLHVDGGCLMPVACILAVCLPCLRLSIRLSLRQTPAFA